MAGPGGREEMPDGLTLEELPGHLVWRYTGPYRFPEIADAAHAIGELSAARGALRVMIDIRASAGGLSVAERYQVANEMGHRWDPRLRLAVVGRQDQQLPDRPWEVVANERGLLTRVFVSGTEAVAWLLAEDAAG